MQLKPIKSKKHKGQIGGIGELPLAIIMLVVIGIILVIGAQITGTIQDDITDTTSAEYNATVDVLDSIDTTSGWLPTLALVIIAGVIISVLFGALVYSIVKRR